MKEKMRENDNQITAPQARKAMDKFKLQADPVSKTTKDYLSR